MKLRGSILGITWLVGVFFAPGMAFAAVDLFTFHTVPETPAPDQAVTVSLQSYAVDLNAAKITWYVDKEVVRDGVAEKSIKTRTKGFGDPTVINVVVSTIDGGRFDKQFLLKPIEVDLLWEADTFVPPFYKGKALPTYKSQVKLSAIPRFNASSSNPSMYAYTWTANQIQGLKGSSGGGSVTLPMKYSGTAIPVTVRINNPGVNGETGSASLNIVAVDPQLVFYEDAPLLGIRFDHALSESITTNGTSFRIHAVPYFFSNDDMENGDLSYSWQKDSERFSGAELDPNSLLLGKVGKSAQGSTVALTVQNRKRILQQAAVNVVVNFASEQ